MGQCSTLPAEARQNASSPVGNHGGYYHDQERDDYTTGRRGHHGYVPQKNQNPTAAMTDSSETGRYSATKRNNNGMLQVKVPQNTPSSGTPSRSRQAMVKFADMKQHSSPRNSKRYVPVTTPPPHPSRYTQDPEPMEEVRYENPPSPPDSAKRTRCYKLNLDSNYVGLTGGNPRLSEGQLLGPFAEAPPDLTHTISEDSSITADPTAVAVRTAQIFRGITVGPDGTILTQNARAARANRNKNKRGEKSRQAAKIDKAKDLVEESIATGKVSCFF